MRKGEFNELKGQLDPKALIEDIVTYLHGRPNTNIHKEMDHIIGYFNGETDWYNYRYKPTSIRNYVEKIAHDFVMNNTYLAPAVARQVNGLTPHLSRRQEEELFKDTDISKIFADKVIELWKVDESLNEEGRKQRKAAYCLQRLEENDERKKIEELLTLCGFEKNNPDTWKREYAVIKLENNGIYMYLHDNTPWSNPDRKEYIDFNICLKWVADNMKSIY